MVCLYIGCHDGLFGMVKSWHVILSSLWVREDRYVPIRTDILTVDQTVKRPRIIMSVHMRNGDRGTQCDAWYTMCVVGSGRPWNLRPLASA